MRKFQSHLLVLALALTPQAWASPQASPKASAQAGTHEGSTPLVHSKPSWSIHHTALLTELDAEKAISRWIHAKELMGKQYPKSVVKSGEEVAMIDQFLILWTSKALPETWKHQSRPIANTIIQQSQKYGFDPVFLMSVIENESSFNPEALGSAGEIGLMQITPETGAWITELFEIPWKGKKTLKNPVSNIIIGSAYLAYLREEFDYRGQLYLAAYNMGSGNVRKHLNRNTQPQVYPSRVMQRYLRFYSELQNSLKSKPSGTWASVGKKPETYSSALQSRQQSWASKPKKHLTHSNQLRPL